MICIEEMLAVRVFTAIQLSAQLLSAAADNIAHCPMMAGQHFGAEAVDVIRSVAAEYFRQLDHGALKICHQLIDGFYGHGLCFFSQMRVDTGSGRAAMAQPGLDEPQVDAGFQKVRCPGMPQRMHRRLFVDKGGFQCFAKSDLNAAIAYRCCGVRHVFAAMTGRGKYPDFVSVAYPLFTQ